VVCADGLIRVGDRGVLPEKERAVVSEVLKKPVGIAGLHFEVLGRVLVGDAHHLLVALANDYLTAVPPSLPGDILGRPTSFQPAIYLPNVASPTSREVVSRIAGEVGPCSACPKRSAARRRGSAESSAMIRISVGPARRSMPTVPKSCRFASAT